MKFNWLTVLVPAAGVVLVGTTDSASAREFDKPLRLASGEQSFELLQKSEGNDSNLEAGHSIMLDYRLNAGFVAGQFKLNLAGAATDSEFRHKYGDRLHDDPNAFVEIYSAEFKHMALNYDMTFFYHMPRYHWGYEGDDFGFLPEATDIPGADKWNEKMPKGVEVAGKGPLDGLKIVAGEEVYWGAEPQVIAKYRFGENDQYTAVVSQEFESDVSKASLQGTFDLSDTLSLRVGGAVVGQEKVGERYEYVSDKNIYSAEIQDEDTLAGRARLTFTPDAANQFYGQVEHAGLVANVDGKIKEFGSNLPYSGDGNKQTMELGAKIRRGDYMFNPRVFSRRTLRAANPSIETVLFQEQAVRGTRHRNTDLDPFAVHGSRAVNAAEFYMTYDPTPATYFYEWNNDDLEDAPLAFNAGVTVMDFLEETDAFIAENENDDEITFSKGMPKQTLWVAKAKVVLNPDENTNWLFKAEAGKQQAQDGNVEANDYWRVEGRLTLDKTNVYSASYAKDQFGPHDYHREFGTKYPEQIEVGYARRLNDFDGGKSGEAGVKVRFRSQEGDLDDQQEIELFFKHQF